jgi:predicted dehydrogenase
MNSVRVLVVGLGFFGKNWLREVSICQECEAGGVVSKHRDLLAAVGDEFAIPAARRFASIEEALDRADVQAAIVAVPEMFHREVIVAALERRLHVLTEKPLAMSMTEAREILGAARRSPTSVVMVDQNYRWRVQNQTLRRAVREGRIGQIVSVIQEFRQAITRTTTDAWRERMPHPFLHDMAPHHLDLLRVTTGLECQEIVAVGVRPPWSWYQGIPGVDALFTFDRGLRVTYTGTMVARGLTTPQEGIITLMGERGSLRLESDSQVRCYGETGTPEVIPPVSMPVSDVAYALREFLASIREDRKPETHLEDNLRTLAMVEAAIAAVETGQRVTVAPLVAEALGESGK